MRFASNRIVCRLLANLATLVAFVCTGAFGQGLGAGTIFTDLWWIPTESGWGVTVDHQNEVMFLTFFIYRADGSPYWVTGSLNRVGSGTTVPLAFTGDLYETKGPYFGDAAFNPGLVTYHKVGTATFTALQRDAATLQYSVNGAPVSKSLQRQTLRLIDFSGRFVGVLDFVLSNCASPSSNNQEIAKAGLLTVTQNGTSLNFTLQNGTDSCTYGGTYTQSGSIGSMSGTYSCNDGTAGPFSLDSMQWTIVGLSAAINGKYQSCDFRGVMGGVGAH